MDGRDLLLEQVYVPLCVMMQLYQSEIRHMPKKGTALRFKANGFGDS